MKIGLRSVVVGYEVSAMELRSDDCSKECNDLIKKVIATYPDSMQLIEPSISVQEIGDNHIIMFTATVMYDKLQFTSSYLSEVLRVFGENVAMYLDEFLQIRKIRHSRIR